MNFQQALAAEKRRRLALQMEAAVEKLLKQSYFLGLELEISATRYVLNAAVEARTGCDFTALRVAQVALVKLRRLRSRAPAVPVPVLPPHWVPVHLHARKLAQASAEILVQCPTPPKPTPWRVYAKHDHPMMPGDMIVQKHYQKRPGRRSSSRYVTSRVELPVGAKFPPPDPKPDMRVSERPAGLLAAEISGMTKKIEAGEALYQDGNGIVGAYTMSVAKFHNGSTDLKLSQQQVRGA